MVFTIVTVAEMQFMAGENRDATGDVTANHQFLHNWANAYLSAMLEYDILANWSSPLLANFKPILSEWAARFAGMSLIAFNMTTWNTNTSLIEAEDLIQTHIYRMEKIENILKQAGARKLLGGS